MNDRIRALLKGQNLSAIAREADVPYDALWYFKANATAKFNADYAERVLAVLEKQPG